MASSVPEAKRGHNGGVTESKADLVSIEVSDMNQPTFSMSAWARRTKLEKILTVLLMLLTIALVVVAVLGFQESSPSSISSRDHSLTSKQWAVQDESAGKVCNSKGCISAAHHILENMDPEVDPCDDFYQYACGGFEKRVRRCISC